ncbi:nuclear transport factor 2 family protein [Pseudoduganella namucuonensis]|uniref:SnoaL-like domain-containing protein n=1 Tax=Pseudoduganella namucuonensis TaxID=1035707 RepID=A0A1I7LVT8_9BURK|nr:tetratricopeptide repeat protein [Pseudoduganella namucuonensis]SFV13821.1 SnoaL-like domain-containing protein [Pseudoduganella namucuonensis]
MRKSAGFGKLITVTMAAAALCAPVFAVEVSDVSALLRAKRYDTALARADEHLAAKPDDPRIRFLKGLALTGLGRRDEAIALLTALSADYPAMPELYNNLAVLHAAAGQPDKARAALEGAVKANPGYARGHENLADMYLQLAAQSYAAMLKLEPNNAEVRARQALLQSAMNYGGERAAGVPKQEAEVVAAVHAWAQAWSARDVPAYLAFYGRDFQPPGDIPRAAWEAERGARLKEASVIHVALKTPQVSLDGSRATATFEQSYRSDRSSSTVQKTLVLEKHDGAWKIVREDSRK